MRKVTHGGVSGSAKDDVDKQRIEGGVETKYRRNSHKHGIGHTWKKIHTYLSVYIFLGGFLKTELMEEFDFLSFYFFSNLNALQFRKVTWKGLLNDNSVLKLFLLIQK